MALLDLSLVTKTLINVVRNAISVSPARPPQVVNVTSLPPDKLIHLDNSIGIYLYHFVEEAAIKNQVWPNRPLAPQRFSPIGLNLHYIVTANSTSELNESPFREQLLMGLATKALHDYPVIEDDTKVAAAVVMPSAMTGEENRIRIALRHVPANEAVSFWTAGSQPLRLSSYYEVSVVLVEPDEPTIASGRVLTWSVDAFIGGLPRLTGSKASVTFKLPTEPAPRTLEIAPAQIPIGGTFTLFGEDLGSGAIELLIGNGKDLVARPVPAWGASVFGNEISARVSGDVDGVPTVPGTYQASVRIQRQVTAADGSVHQQAVSSNTTPFQVVPATTVDVPTASGVFNVTGGLFAPTSEIHASIGPVVLVPGIAGSLATGEFAVISSSHLELRIPAGATPGQALPVRITINGCESPPAWVVAP